jgi:hypothetical protein
LIFDSRFWILDWEIHWPQKCARGAKIEPGNFSPPSHGGTEPIQFIGVESNPQALFTTKARSTQSQPSHDLCTFVAPRFGNPKSRIENPKST